MATSKNNSTTKNTTNINNMKEGIKMTKNNMPTQDFPNPDEKTMPEFAMNWMMEGGNVNLPTINGNPLETEFGSFVAFCKDGEDKRAFDEFMRSLAKASGYDAGKATMMLLGTMTMATEGYQNYIHQADELVTAEDGEQYIVNYVNQKLFNGFGQEVASLEGYDEYKLPKELVKKMLLDKIKE